MLTVVEADGSFWVVNNDGSILAKLGIMPDVCQMSLAERVVIASIRSGEKADALLGALRKERRLQARISHIRGRMTSQNFRHASSEKIDKKIDAIRNGVRLMTIRGSNLRQAKKRPTGTIDDALQRTMHNLTQRLSLDSWDRKFINLSANLRKRFWGQGAKPTAPWDSGGGHQEDHTTQGVREPRAQMLLDWGCS